MGVPVVSTRTQRSPCCRSCLVAGRRPPRKLAGSATVVAIAVVSAVAALAWFWWSGGPRLLGIGCGAALAVAIWAVAREL
jgi:hypothetical protein